MHSRVRGSVPFFIWNIEQSSVYLLIHANLLLMKKTLLFVLMSLSLIACGAKKEEQENDPEDKMEVTNEKAYTAIIATYNSNDISKISDLVADDFLDHSASPDQKPGLAGYKEHMEMFKKAFPDLHVTIKLMSADSDRVYAHVNWKASFTGEMMGMTPTGKSTDVEGMEMLRFKDGKLVERWGYFEQLKMMTELGLMPGTPPAAPKK
jgi:steroid delta-isomerase-like uncharacterized protein